MKLFDAFRKLPILWQGIITIALLAVIVGGAYWLIGSVQKWSYNRARAQFEQQRQEWMSERAKLLGEIGLLRQERDEAKARAATYEAQAEKGKKVDESIAEKVSELDKQAAAEATNTDLPADCTVRADRTCAKLASLKPPIILDCAIYKRKLCQ